MAIKYASKLWWIPFAGISVFLCFGWLIVPDWVGYLLIIPWALLAFKACESIRFY